jgi:hypothetical protein
MTEPSMLIPQFFQGLFELMPKLSLAHKKQFHCQFERAKVLNKLVVFSA